jgi:hypothetical protein
MLCPSFTPLVRSDEHSSTSSDRHTFRSIRGDSRAS